jgi:hypothetical protein
MLSGRLLTLANASDLQAAGGHGGAGGASRGGGGGGGGGYVRIVCADYSVGSGTINAATCAPGGAGGTVSGGSNVAGTAGGNGTVQLIVLNVGAAIPLATAHEEEGFISVNAGDTLKTITFATPFTAAPPSAGGYSLQISILRTDGVIAQPAWSSGIPAVDHVDINIIDSFQGVITWRASVK